MKKCFALLLVLALSVTAFVGCHSKDDDLSYALTGTLNGETQQFPVGPYRYYVQWMTDYYHAYIETIAAQAEQKFVWSDMLADTTLTAPQTLSDYIITTAKEQYLTWLYIETTFDEMGLSLDAEDEKEIDRIIQTDWVAIYGNDGFNSIRKALGLSYDEFRNIMACNLKSEKILDAFYGEGGPNEITEQEKKDYFANNFVRFKYVVLMLQDSDGNAYNDKRVAEIQATVDSIVDQLDKGASFEDMIVQYSDDYTEITDEMTVTEKESYELQNATMLEDGLIIDGDGVFSETLATYYNISVNEAIVDKVFSMKDGEYATVALKESIWVVQRYPNDAKESYYTDVENLVFTALYGDDLAAKHIEWSSRLNYTYNEAVVAAYRPENLADLFQFSSSPKS